MIWHPNLLWLSLANIILKVQETFVKSRFKKKTFVIITCYQIRKIKYLLIQFLNIFHFVIFTNCLSTGLNFKANSMKVMEFNSCHSHSKICSRLILWMISSNPCKLSYTSILQVFSWCHIVNKVPSNQIYHMFTI